MGLGIRPLLTDEVVWRRRVGQTATGAPTFEAGGATLRGSLTEDPELDMNLERDGLRPRALLLLDSAPGVAVGDRIEAGGEAYTVLHVYRYPVPNGTRTETAVLG